MSHVAVHAVGDQAALHAQREIFLRIGGDHDDAANDAQADAKAEPHGVRQRIVRLRGAGDQQPAETPVHAQAKCAGQRRAPGHALLPARSEEHTSELQSLTRISYAVFCLKKKTKSQERHQKMLITSVKKKVNKM